MASGVRGEGVRTPARADVVVLTALEVEYRAVRAQLAEVHGLTEERGSLFELGVCRAVPGASGPGAPVPGAPGPAGDRVVALHMTGPGNPAAAALAERATALFAPSAVLFVGVAGGRKDVRLGDVVAADAVYDYETGKDTADGFVPRQKTQPCGYSLVQRARAVAVDDRWQDRISPAPGDRPRAHVKPIAAGGRVVAHPDSAVGRLLTRGAGDAVAVDMEAYGFLTGAFLTRDVDALVVRGISDLLGDKGEAHDERWQPVAARHAAAFAAQLITGLPAAPRPRAARTEPRSARARGPAERRRLAVAELGALVDALLAVPGLTSPQGWQQLLDLLPTVGTTVPRQSASRSEAVALVRSCDEHQAWNSLWQALTLLAPDAQATAEFGALVGELGLR